MMNSTPTYDRHLSNMRAARLLMEAADRELAAYLAAHPDGATAERSELVAAYRSARAAYELLLTDLVRNHA